MNRTCPLINTLTLQRDSLVCAVARVLRGSPRATGGMGDRAARTTTQPTNSWDEKQKEHLGSKSALLAPNEGRRRAARASGTGGFKRAGWAAFDEEDTPKPTPRSHKKKVPSADAGPSSGGRATPTGKGSADKSAGGTPTSQAESTGKKRPRELFPGEDPPLPSRTRELFPVGEEGEEGDGDGDGDGHADPEAMVAQAEFEESSQGNGGAGEALPKKKRNRGKRHDEGDAPELKPRHLRGKRKEELLARQAANLNPKT